MLWNLAMVILAVQMGMEFVAMAKDKNEHPVDKIFTFVKIVCFIIIAMDF